MIPKNGTLANQAINIEQQPSRTYKVDFEAKRTAGMTDDLDAVKQAVFKLLQTEKDHYLIYSSNYGIELNGLIGRDRIFVQSELKRRIQEALLQDDRIKAIEDVQITFDEDQALATFVVLTQYGSFNVNQRVMQSV
ncbi:DUF2634 domain-containing protein [Desulfotomaculum sp. 1211_IL3151]|uniref:DUF2634 domain-containing protein n=1 Tax=Desulfotomaculum sp. 1211_IL3151 TaxID=3084055 RepID=UPI002FDA45D5